MYPTTRSIGHNGNFILDMTPDNTSSNCNVISYRPPYFTPTRSKNKRTEVKRTSSWNLLPSLARYRNSNLHCCILKLFGLSSYISLFLIFCLPVPCLPQTGRKTVMLLWNNKKSWNRSFNSHDQAVRSFAVSVSFVREQSLTGSIAKPVAEKARMRSSIYIYCLILCHSNKITFL